MMLTVDGPLPRCRWALTPTWFGWQGDRKQVRNVGQRVFKVLESRQPEGPSLRPLLPVVSKVASLAPSTFHEGTPSCKSSFWPVPAQR